MDETSNGLPFDPDAIRAKIAEMRRQVQGLETLLDSYGLPVETEARPARVPRPRSRGRSSRNSRRRTARPTPAPTNQKKPTVADAAAVVLAELQGRAHGKKIVEGLQRRGLLKDVAHPGSSVSTALSRDSRFVKVQDAPNTWALSKES